MPVTLLSITQAPQKVIEFAARTCYNSFDKMKEGSDTKIIEMLIKNKHFTPIEHAYATFQITGYSRAMSHQLVRHRLLSISQKSQRYVEEDNFNFVYPELETPKLLSEYQEDMRQIKDLYKKWRQHLKREDARLFLPNACETELVISGNFREFRHIIEMRCDKHAQWEIRECSELILKHLFAHAPAVFNDLFERFLAPKL